MLKTRILTVLALFLGLAAPSHAYFEEMVKELENKWIVQLGMLREVVTGLTLDLESKLKDQNQQTPEAIAKWFDQMRADFKKKSENTAAGVSQSKLPECVKKFFLKIIDSHLSKLELLRQRLVPQKTSQESAASQTDPSL
jgi:preprotein translocase subunit SecA